MAGELSAAQALMFTVGYRCPHCGAVPSVKRGRVGVRHDRSCPRDRPGAGEADGSRLLSAGGSEEESSSRWR
jgi:hypothetical protein